MLTRLCTFIQASEPSGSSAPLTPPSFASCVQSTCASLVPLLYVVSLKIWETIPNLDHRQSFNVCVKIKCRSFSLWCQRFCSVVSVHFAGVVLLQTYLHVQRCCLLTNQRRLKSGGGTRSRQSTRAWIYFLALHLRIKMFSSLTRVQTDECFLSRRVRKHSGSAFHVLL